jgi:hypothetical protein
MRCEKRRDKIQFVSIGLFTHMIFCLVIHEKAVFTHPHIEEDLR